MATANLPGIPEIISPGASNISNIPVEAVDPSPGFSFEDVINRVFNNGKTVQVQDDSLTKLQEGNDQGQMDFQGAYALLNAFYNLLAQHADTCPDILQNGIIPDHSNFPGKGIATTGQEDSSPGDINKDALPTAGRPVGPGMSTVAKPVRQDKAVALLKAWKALNREALAIPLGKDADNGSLTMRLRALFVDGLLAKDNENTGSVKPEDTGQIAPSQAERHRGNMENLLPLVNDAPPHAPLAGVSPFSAIRSTGPVKQTVAGQGKTIPNAVRDPDIVADNHEATNPSKPSHTRAVPPARRESSPQSRGTAWQGNNKPGDPKPAPPPDDTTDKSLREPRPVLADGHETNRPSFAGPKGNTEKIDGQHTSRPFKHHEEAVNRATNRNIQGNSIEEDLKVAPTPGPKDDMGRSTPREIIETKVDTVSTRSKDSRAKVPNSANGTVGAYNHTHAPPLKETKGQQVPGGADVAGQLSKGISEAVKSNHGRLVLHLNPPELGSVQIRIVVNHHNEINASFLVEHPETRHAIEQNLEGLRQQLTNQGFSLGEVNVGLGYGGGFGYPGGQDGRQIFTGPALSKTMETVADKRSGAEQLRQVVITRPGSSVHLIA